MLESGMRIVEIPAAERESAVIRPENLRNTAISREQY